MKKIILFFAVCGTVLASCSKTSFNNDGLETPNHPDYINFTANTSKADVNSIAELKLSADGFAVYATSGSSATAWHTAIDGTNNYKWSTSKWTWSGASPVWPVDPNAGYPMKFYAFFPATNTGFTPANTTGADMTLTGELEIQEAIDAQVDFLAAKSEVTSKPISGSFAMKFNHITSKVNFGIVTGVDVTATVNTVSINNLINKGTYNFLNSTWAHAAVKGNYVYLKSGSDYSNTPSSVEGTISQIFNQGEHLMLIPQKATAVWNGVATEDGATGEATAITDAYIGMNYRLLTTTADDVVGYATRLNCETETMWEIADTEDYAKYKVGGTYTDPLYVKVGFKFAGPINWTAGKGYMFNIQLGTVAGSGGIYLSKYYYDKDGKNTKIAVDGSPAVGDPVSDGKIHFDVEVGDWVNDKNQPKPIA